MTSITRGKFRAGKVYIINIGKSDPGSITPLPPLFHFDLNLLFSLVDMNDSAIKEQAYELMEKCGFYKKAVSFNPHLRH